MFTASWASSRFFGQAILLIFFCCVCALEHILYSVQFLLFDTSRLVAISSSITEKPQSVVLCNQLWFISLGREDVAATVGRASARTVAGGGRREGERQAVAACFQRSSFFLMHFTIWNAFAVYSISWRCRFFERFIRKNRNIALSSVTKQQRRQQQQDPTRHNTTTIKTFEQARSLHPTLGSGSMLFPKQAAQPNPSYPALCRQDTTWSTDYGEKHLWLKERQRKMEKKETFCSTKTKMEKHESGVTSNGPPLSSSSHTLRPPRPKNRIFTKGNRHFDNRNCSTILFGIGVCSDD